ncbi:MAG: hypothetical protein M1548_02480 [Actinobacteria bacterium]|nr:hypothetical protein [Actinomycetota bacterium]
MDIERSLLRIKERLGEEAFRGHELLTYSGVAIPDRLIIAELLLRSSEPGKYDAEKLEWVGVSLELMQLAVARHYESHSGDPNVSLITADYYYARAISIASNLPCVRAVDALSRAILEVAAAEAVISLDGGNGDGEEILGERAGLFAIAGELAGHLSEVDEVAIARLSNFTRRAGVIHLLKSGTLPQSLVGSHPPVARVKEDAASILKDLPGQTAISLAQYMAALTA